MEAAKSAEAAVAGEGLYWAGNAALGDKKPADAAVQFNRYVAKFPKSELSAKAQLERNLEREKEAAAANAGLTPQQIAAKLLGS